METVPLNDHDPLLYGVDKRERIIAIDYVPGKGKIVIFRREDESKGGVTWTAKDFHPFLLTTIEHILRNLPGLVDVEELEGKGEYRYLARFENDKSLWDAAKRIAHTLRALPAEEDDGNRGAVSVISSIPTQYMILTGATTLLGMQYEDLHRLQLDIETYTSKDQDGQRHHFTDPKRVGDEILIICTKDNRGWEQIISGEEYSEAEMIQRFVETVNERDPDVIEVYNCEFDLNFIQTRANRHRISLNIGREVNGVRPRMRCRPRLESAGRFNPITHSSEYLIFGRHVVDIYLAVLKYDTHKRIFSGRGLKDVAETLGLNKNRDRTFIPGERISDVWDSDPERVVRYCLDDVRDVDGISRHIMHADFALTKMCPANLRRVYRRGTATLIELLLKRAFLAQKRAIPAPEPPRGCGGGLTEIYARGVFDNVFKADVSSLYPSIMLTKKIKPSRDQLNVFLKLLEHLTRRRLEAKAKLKAIENARPQSNPTEGESDGPLGCDLEYSRIDGEQSSFKVLINSFYGYLGTGGMCFNDFNAANNITKFGREILRKTVDLFHELDESKELRILEIDTDGLLLSKKTPSTYDEELAIIERVNEHLPEGIELAHDGRWQRVYSKAEKNYALLGYDGEIQIVGLMKARNKEKILLDFVEKGLRLLMQNDLDGLRKLYLGSQEKIARRKVALEDVVRAEECKLSAEAYRRSLAQSGGRKNRQAVYELMLRSHGKFKAGDTIQYFITGNSASAPIYENVELAHNWSPEKLNVPLMLKRLNETAKTTFDAAFDKKKLNDMFPTASPVSDTPMLFDRI